MPKRNSGDKTAEARKLQNRINQRAFRERKRRELDEMREALACMKAVTADVGRENRNPGVEVDGGTAKQGLNHQPPEEPSDGTLRPADLMSGAVLPTTEGTFENGGNNGNNNNKNNNNNEVSFPLLGNGATYEPCFRNEARNQDSLHVDNYTQAGVADFGCIPRTYEPITFNHATWPATNYYEPGQQTCGVPAYSDTTSGIMTLPAYYTDIAADYTTAQHLALKSAEWYAKAAEVGLLKLAVLHQPTDSAMSTWQQYPPNYLAPSGSLESISQASSNPLTSSTNGELPSHQTPYSTSLDDHKSCTPDSTQVYSWDTSGQLAQL